MFCKFCANEIDENVIICPRCGKQVAELKIDDSNYKQVIINNSASSSASTESPVVTQTSKVPREKNKWIAFLLCLLLGYIGAHKFYEGKIIFGIIYILTLGFWGIGILIDLVLILLKPNPYYV